MGVDIQTYRSRIGTYSHSLGRDVVTIVNVVNFSDGMRTIGCVLFIGVLLIMAGIEPNPGPIDKDTPSGHSDEHAEIVNAKQMSAEVLDTSKVTEQANVPRIKIFGLVENINKEMLEMFFEREEKHGGGKVKSIDIDKDNSCAKVEFEKRKDIDAFMKRKSKTILGMEVRVEIIDTTPQISLVDATCIKISRLMENINKEVLEMVFEREERSGGGKVKNIDIDSKNKCAIVEFEEETGVESIMRKETLSILGIEAHIDTVGSDTEEPKIIKITKLPVHMNVEMLKMFFENKKYCDGKVVDVKVDSEKHYATVEFEESAAVQKVTAIRPFAIFGYEVEVDVFDPDQVCEVDGQKGVSIDDANQTDMENVHTSESIKKTSPELDSQIFSQMLQKLGLADKYPGKIPIKDIVAADPNESNEQENGNICLPDIPWLVLKRLICSHSESRDITINDESCFNDRNDLVNTMSFISEISEEKQNISPLDIFSIIFQCCDPFLKQLIVQKLYLCKIAIPFMHRYWEADKKELSILSVWPLRSLAIENKQIRESNREVKCTEVDVLELPTKMIAFGRFGRPRYSKSKLLNSLLSTQGCKTFFNIDCPAGMTPRTISNGQTEMFWLPTVGNKKDRFTEAMTFFNLRGDMNQHFDEDTLSFLSKFVDAFAIIIDIDSIFRQGENVKTVLLKFSSVMLIIANPLTSEKVKKIDSFQKYVLSCKPDINLRILSTHKGAVEQNVVDMVSSISRHISDQLTSSFVRSYQERFEQAKLLTRKTDEEGADCQKGKEECVKMIKQMKAEGISSEWKQRLTPVHCKFSKHLGILIKRREREKDFKVGNIIDGEIKEVRQKQMKSITATVKLFIDTLMKHKENIFLLKYFLCWLHFHIENEKRKVVPQLMHDYRLAWKNLKILKSKEEQNHSDIVQLENTITKLEEKIDEASFSVEHFFREIGHINEAVLVLQQNVSTFGLPPPIQMAYIIGRLVADGHQLELIDGESFYMPYTWIKAVVREVEKCIESEKVLTLSVLGLQSSGKSTFLNTMFGCQFSTRTGRCTRGIHVQLIPANTSKFKSKISEYDYLLVVDTEGLRSPELSHVQHEHDNELATVITGIGDITMINIMGENTSEIRDILQVIVHAFLRLKMTNEKLDIKKCCSFIHQNVTDTSASENMISGLSKLIQTLDEVTRESARSEGIINITAFNQVIEFDISSEVWYLKNLWQGNPPMARVNTEYSEKVVEIKSSILQKALKAKDKSYKSLSDITEHAHDLWKGVLCEDFVFSFRNSIEIKAYMAMEHVVQDQHWHLESFIRDKMIQKSQRSFATCDQEESLRTVANTLMKELTDLLLERKIKSEKEIAEYFEKDKYKDIIIQWKAGQQSRFDFLCHKLETIIKDQIEKDLEKRSVEILTVTCHDKHEEELRRTSMDVANRYKGQQLSEEKIDKLFDEIWQSFVRKVSTPSSIAEKKRRKMIDIFHTCLTNAFSKHFAVLKKVLEQSGNLTPLSNISILKGTFNQTGIDETDINLTYVQKGKKFFNFGTNAMKYVEKRVNQVFETVDEKIQRLCQVREEITEMSINKLMHELDSSIQDILIGETEYKFQMPFYVKIYVHVSRHAHAVFEKHNDSYYKTYGAAACLEKYRIQQKISFEAHVRCRQFEDIVSKLFTNVIETFAEEWISKILPNKITDALYSHLPPTKNRVIIEICTDLLEKEDFKTFIRYIHTPKEYASAWITDKANEYLFASESRYYTKISSVHLQRVFVTVSNCVREAQKKYNSCSSVSVENWIESFRKIMTASDFSVSTECFRNLKKETKHIQNLEYLTNEILNSLKRSEDEIILRLNQNSSSSVQWANLNPVDHLIIKIWGCEERCAFCGEPCAKNENHTGSEHNCIQHRPLCCDGARNKSSQHATLESCEFHVQADYWHNCPACNYRCNNGKMESCGKDHYYKKYKDYIPNWHISPSSSMHDTSKYWMWFVATYKESLQTYFNYKLDNIPSSWREITKSQALKSLSDTFAA